MASVDQAAVVRNTADLSNAERKVVFDENLGHHVFNPTDRSIIPARLATDLAAAQAEVAAAAGTAAASWLSNSKASYNFDFVVATTQASINADITALIAKLKAPETIACYVADDNGNPTPIDYETLKSKANADPFKVPVGAKTNTNEDLAKLMDSRFMMAIRFTLGIPHSVRDIADLPDIVTLGSDASSVTFNMLCSEFTICQLVPPGGYSTVGSWIVESQPTGSAKDLWIFSSKVDLTFSKTTLQDLPPNVQAQIIKKVENIGGNAFSLQQLLYDLDNAGLQTVPALPASIAPGMPLYTLLEGSFIGVYFAAMKQGGTPLLGLALVQDPSPDPSTLKLTSFRFGVDPLLQPNGDPIPSPSPDQLALTTLNYQCAADGNTLPPVAKFPWNWVTDNTDHDGVVAINRNTLANYFRNQLSSYINSNCLVPYARSVVDGTSVDYPITFTQGTTPITIPESGATVLTAAFTKSSSDVAGLDGDLGAITVTDSFSIDVQFVELTSGVPQVIITQHVKLYIDLRRLQTSGSGNVVDIQLVDTYTIGVDDNGRLVATVKPTVTNHSYIPSVSGFLDFFTGLNGILESVAGVARQAAETKLQDMPISFIQDFVFPGGKTFIFKNASFSEHQDLLAEISYAA